MIFCLLRCLWRIATFCFPFLYVRSCLLFVLGQVPAKIFPSWTRDKSSPRDKAHWESVKQVQVLHFFSPNIPQILIKSLFVSWWQNWVSESPSVRPRPLRNKPSVYSSHTLSFNCPPTKDRYKVPALVSYVKERPLHSTILSITIDVCFLGSQLRPLESFDPMFCRCPSY